MVKNFLRKGKVLASLMILSYEPLLYGAAPESPFFDTGDPKVLGLDFSREYSYITRSGVPLEKEDENLFLTHPVVRSIAFPETSASASVQALEMPTDVLSSEIALKRLIPGKDGRHPVHNPEREALYRVHAQVMMQFTDGEYGGSGTLIGPYHFLTAAHNLYDRTKKEWTSRIRVRFALEDNYLPFDQQRVIRAYTYRQWVEGSGEDAQSCDLALFVLDQPIGNKIGWHGLSYLHKDAAALKGQVHIAGYPKEVRDTLYPNCETLRGGSFKKMWRMSNVDNSNEIVPIEVSEEHFYYQIDTSGGQSGSGIVWLKEPGKAYVIGVHAYGEGENGRGNYGTRLTREKLLDIQKWMSATYEISRMYEGTTKAESVSQLQPCSGSVIGSTLAGEAKLSVGKNMRTVGSENTKTTVGMDVSDRAQAAVGGDVRTSGGSTVTGVKLRDNAVVEIDGELTTEA